MLDKKVVDSSDMAKEEKPVVSWLDRSSIQESEVMFAAIYYKMLD